MCINDMSLYVSDIRTLEVEKKTDNSSFVGLQLDNKGITFQQNFEKGGISHIVGKFSSMLCLKDMSINVSLVYHHHICISAIYVQYHR